MPLVESAELYYMVQQVATNRDGAIHTDILTVTMKLSNVAELPQVRVSTRIIVFP